MAKLPIKVIDPHVKLRANFCGFNANIGTPTKNAKAKNRPDKSSNAQNTFIKLKIEDSIIGKQKL
jgi:hypothetical protein